MPGLERITQAVLDRARPTQEMVAVDLGCGSGQLTLPLARKASRVIAVDVSPAMIARLLEKAAADGMINVTGEVAPIETFDLPAASVDLVVSNYALHHLRDIDKSRLVASATRWLRPGGRLVIGDMMIGLGRDSHDRAVIASKVAVLIGRGPAGWWRLTKNALRLLLRIQERPVAVSRWEEMLRSAGLAAVASETVVAEAALVWGTRTV